jgi:molecular chaperone DnaK
VKESENIGDIRSAIEQLNQAWNEVSSKLYSQQDASQQAQGAEAKAEGAGSKQDGDNVEEADFEVVDDDNKDKS